VNSVGLTRAKNGSSAHAARQQSATCHMDRQVPLHYVVANERDNGHPKVLVMCADGVETHTLDFNGLVWLTSNLQIFYSC
jgi:hypothetical protein